MEDSGEDTQVGLGQKNQSGWEKESSLENRRVTFLS
jgi:hypothetical protein